MNITVLPEDNMPSDKTGGEYATCDVVINYDPHLPWVTQKELIVHAVIENYCLSWGHDKVEELTDLITDALDQLEAESLKSSF